MGSFWDRVSGFYDWAESLNRQAYQGIIRETVRWISPGSRVLDCAAGTGDLSLAAAKKADYVLSTDLSAAMLAQAREKALKSRVENLEFARRDLFSPPPERLFDAVIAGNVLHLLDQPEHAVKCLTACVHPGGRVILPTFLQGEASPSVQFLLEAYRVLGFRPKHRYTLKSYEAMLRGAFPGYLELTRIPGRLPAGFGVLIV